eukprot:TRINITY_DN17445_c0_g1_i1.p1 TRINITY_DN17445_c0_g1~~TRINITY_DN17445_c0_g1_i1.p1  ORF type:complete len:461 (+),score=96.48 TRINITY_DN17445_c0_g1_i1:35-1417(+)
MPRSPPLASSDKLNANAQPFVPPEASESEKTPWQRQADMLGSRKSVTITDAKGNPVDLTPPSNAATPSSCTLTPLQHPQTRTPVMPPAMTPPSSYSRSPPTIYNRSPTLSGMSPYQSSKPKCPSGHPLQPTLGSQMVCRQSGLVMCGSVFCRRCDTEELDVNPQGYYTCPLCNWDCCLACSTLPYTPVTGSQNVPPGVPPMPPLPASLKAPPPYSSEVLQSIHGLLTVLKEEAPCGLATMPTNRLVEYETYLRSKLPTLEETYAMPAPVPNKKVSVMKTDDMPVRPQTSERRREKPPPPLAYAVKDRVMFVGGGRFPGNKTWKDGAKLKKGEVGIVKEIDFNEKFPFKCQFENVYVMLTEDDLQEPPPEPVKASLKKEKQKEKKPKEKPSKKEVKEKPKQVVKQTEPCQTPEPAPKPTQFPAPQEEVEYPVSPQASLVLPLTMAAGAICLGLIFFLRRKH